MIRRLSALLALTLVLAGFAATRAQAQPSKPPELVASTDPRTPDEERAGFRLPPGFEAQLVVSEPTINKPMNMAFDDRGRLWVTSARVPLSRQGGGRSRRDTVMVLATSAPTARRRKVDGCSPTA